MIEDFHEIIRGPESGHGQAEAPPTDSQCLSMALRHRERFVRIIAEKENVAWQLDADLREAKRNWLPIHERMEEELRRYRWTILQMRAALAEADRIRSGERDEPAEVRPSEDAPAMPRYVGRNTKGVPTYSGDLSVPSMRSVRVNGRWAALFVTCGGLCLLPVGPKTDDGWAIVGLAGIACFVAGWWFASQALHVHDIRSRFADLVPIERLSEEQGVPELTYVTTARERGIEPRCIVNGKEYYHPADFGDEAMLLRAAAAPVAVDDRLLRPAGAATASAETLPRAAAGPDEPAD